MAGERDLRKFENLNSEFEKKINAIQGNEDDISKKKQDLQTAIESYTNTRDCSWEGGKLAGAYQKLWEIGEAHLETARVILASLNVPEVRAPEVRAPEVSLEAKENIKELLETATSTAQAAVAKSLKEAPRILALEKFDTTLVAFQAQIGLIYARFENASDSEREDLMAAHNAAQTTYRVLTQLRDDYVSNTEQTPQAFAQSCLEVLASEENKELNKPRGDWSIGRILGELIRSLKSLVFENATAPRFFKTTTQQKADDIAAAAQEFGSNGPRTGG